MTIFTTHFPFLRTTVLALAIGLGGLTACEMTSPSMINTTPIRVEEHAETVMIKIEDLTPDVARQISDDYHHGGQGMVDVTVLYIADGSNVLADNDAGRIASMLRSSGIKDMNVSSLPVGDLRKAGHVMITYTALVAKPPKGCEAHPGSDRAGIVRSENGQFPQYRFGCEVDTYIAGQVNDPADLIGSDDIDNPNADRASARQQGYRDGKDFKDLDGLNASELQTK